MAKQIELKSGLTLDTPFGSNLPVTLYASTYAAGGLALELVTQHPEGWSEPVARVSVFFPEENLADNEFFCKDWLENEGIADWLEENHLATRIPGGRASGFVYADRFRLSEELTAKLREARHEPT